MEASHRIGKGMKRGRAARSKPQRYWNYCSPVETIPKDVEETILSPTEETRSSCGIFETKGFIREREMTRVSSSKK
jgi:hypothetical protein